MKIKIHFSGGTSGLICLPFLIWIMETKEDVEFMDEIREEIGMDLNENKKTISLFNKQIMDEKINIKELQDTYL